MILFITFTEISIGLTILKVPNALLIAGCIAIFDILPVLGTGGNHDSLGDPVPDHG